MSNSRYVLRPEAGPVLVDSLSQSQEKAMKAIVIAMEEAMTIASHSKNSNDHDCAVDPNRMSRLFFVSGQPGSGKSSLYLTLRQILSDEDRAKKHNDKYPGITKLVSTTRWLEPIDLEVAGDEGENLLASVLVRISDAIGPSPVTDSKDCQDAMTQLDELANDIGIAWDGNLKARGGSLDPDSYSQEVMRAQRTRLHTNRRLREALDKLSKYKCYGCTGETLFVLPIDDFYLKPTASLELLRLLRMISVPRLFFLIMGDIKTMEALFFEKALAEWTNVAGPQIFASLKGWKQQEVLSRVREMKARYFRKLLPTGQRAIIDWMSWDEALRFKPTVTKSAGSVPELRSLLSSIPIYQKDKASKKEFSKLLDYLVSPNPKRDPKQKPAEGNGPVSNLEKKTNKTEDRVKKLQEAYSALLILDAPPREIADLWMCLNELKNELRERGDSCGEQVPLYLLKVVDFVLLAIEEQDFLTEEEQEHLRFAFPSSHKDDLLVKTDKFKLKPKVSPKLEVSLLDDIFVRKHLAWELGISGSQDEKQENTRPAWYLPPRPTAWITLLHDLSWDWDPESITKNLVRRLSEEICNPGPIADEKEKKVRPRAEDPGWAWYRHGDEWIHLPLPCFDTFRQLDRFLMVWSLSLPRLDSEKLLNLDTLFSHWVFAGWTAADSGDLYAQFATQELKMPETKEDEDVRMSEFKKTLLGKYPVWEQILKEE